MKKMKKDRPIEPVKPEEFFMAEEVLVEEWSDCEIKIDPSWPAGTKIRMETHGEYENTYTFLKVIAPERPYPNPRYADEMKEYEKVMKKYERKLAAWEAERAAEETAARIKRIAKLKAELEELESFDNSTRWLVCVVPGFDTNATAERLARAGAKVVNILSAVGSIVIEAESGSDFAFIEGVGSVHAEQKVSHCKVG